MKCLILGSRRFAFVLELQQTLFDAQMLRRRSLQSATQSNHNQLDTLLVCQHSPAVYTIGNRDTTVAGFPGNTKIDSTAKVGQVLGVHEGLEVYKLNRGGGITWHGPGQLVVYPIVNVVPLFRHCEDALKGTSAIRWFVGLLEQTLILSVRELLLNGKDDAMGSPFSIFSEQVGVWVQKRDTEDKARKVASLGIHCSGGISMHGISLNVHNNNSYFKKIVMCEMPGRQATSIRSSLSENALEAKDDYEDLSQALRNGTQRVSDNDLFRSLESRVPRVLHGLLTGSLHVVGDSDVNNNKGLEHGKEQGILSSLEVLDFREASEEHVRKRIQQIIS